MTSEVIGRKQGNGLEVQCMYCFATKQWLINELEVLLQPRVRTSWSWCIIPAEDPSNNFSQSLQFYKRFCQFML